MNRSVERIVATHTGSLPRPRDLLKLMWDKVDGKPVDDRELDVRVRDAVAAVVRR